MAKRVLLAAIIVAAILVVAAPAMAFNGYRGDYTTSDYCSICHKAGQPGGAPKVYDGWLETRHAEAGADDQATRLPYGSSCAGCHVSNYAPSKVVPTPTATATITTATATIGNVSWGAVIPTPFPAQNNGDAFMSENFVGCSSCHYGASTGVLPQYGNDPSDSAHMAPQANLANAEICGACHSRYAYTVNTYTAEPVPYVKVSTPLPGTPIPNPSPTTLLQPQYAIGFPMVGASVAGVWTSIPLSDYLNIPFPGWTPTPNPSATRAAGLMTYWKNSDGSDTMWQAFGHEGSAAQYPEWKSEGHANSLTALGANPQAACLKCHSADYRIAPENAKPTGAQAQYGITCVGCHTPHEKGTAVGAWDDVETDDPSFDTQLITDNAKTLCVECHNGEIPAGTTASPGAQIHAPMKEMMDGYGAIDVVGFPSVHKGKCVKCHMPPTSISRGSVQLGGNHTFNIITPEQADSVQPMPFSTTTPSPGASPVITTVVMPYSACSTCHGRASDPLATYLQDTIDQRQEWTKAKIVEIHAALAAAAGRLGYADASTARNALVAIPAASRTTHQTTFLKAFTNVGYVESEGSFGLHNWDYSRAIANTALVEAQSVKAAPKPWRITFKTSKARVAVNHKVKFSGTVKTSAKVPGAGRVTIQKKVKGHWKAWRTATLNSTGAFAKRVKMTKRGTFYFRAFKPADASNLKKASRSRRLVVK